MERRQGLILYVRTPDRVLLRFPDLDTARTWLEARRLSFDAEYLATDETWQPLDRLFRIDLPPRGPLVTEKPPMRAPSEEPEQTPTVPLFPDDIGTRRFVTPTREDREGPTRVSGKAPEPPVSPVRIRSVQSPAWEADLWGTEPDADRLERSRRLRRMLRVLALVALVSVAGVVAWFLFARPQDGTSDSPTVARQEPTVAPSASAPPAPPPRTPAPTPVGNPVDSGPPQDAGPSAASGPAAPPTAARLPSPPPGPQPPQVSETRPEPRVNATPTAPTPVRASDDLGYDQHMAEGLRLLDRNPRKALAHFQAAGQERPASVEPKVKMAECEYRLGRYREAAALFQKAVEQNPNYGPAIAGLARAHARLGNDKDARFCYMKYLDVNPNGSQAAEARAYLGR